MANSYPNRELDLNYSVQAAVYRILRRRPWKTWTTGTGGTLSRFFLYTLFAAAMTVLLATAARAATQDTFDAEVPFKFEAGNQSFPAGHYQFSIARPGLLKVRDSHGQVVASLVTRSKGLAGPLPASKLVFDTQTTHARLAQLRVKEYGPVLEILGEEPAVQPEPSLTPASPARD
ncbi:MAG: hypothetical protein LAO20_13575 [Acidobacteriia bacterium]|nr:hypothetical protein [Terriglobia bacterium]